MVNALESRDKAVHWICVKKRHMFVSWITLLVLLRMQLCISMVVLLSAVLPPPFSIFALALHVLPSFPRNKLCAHTVSPTIFSFLVLLVSEKITIAEYQHILVSKESGQIW